MNIGMVYTVNKCYLFVHFYLIFYNLRGICFDMDNVLKDVLDLSSVNKLCLKYDI